MTVENEAGQQDEDAVVIHNAEQQEIMAQLKLLIEHTNSVISRAANERDENESLHADAGKVDWDEVLCVNSQRWIDSEGELGWRVKISGAQRDAVRFAGYVTDRLRNEGWENVIVGLSWW